MSPQPLDKSGTVLKVIQDIDYLVHRCDEHINAEFRQFLAGAGCRAAIISQAGYCRLRPRTGNARATVSDRQLNAAGL
jgi:hypothetical protein